MVQTLVFVFTTSLLLKYSDAYRVETEECKKFLNYSTPTSSEYINAQWNFARSASLTEPDWLKSLPTDDEVEELEKFIGNVYAQDSFEDFHVDEELEKYSTLRFLKGTVVQHNQVLIITEKFKPKPSENRFFGFLAIRANDFVDNWIHHSSPHFETDGAVSVQAAVLFDSTLAKTLVVSGVARDAVRGKTNSTCQPGNHVADAAHNTNNFFHKILVAIWKVCHHKRDQFIQWHGMAENNCRKSNAFLSVGANKDHKIYKHKKAFVVKLEKALDIASTNNSFAQTPRTDNACKLVAATNVFGRIVNGVKIGKECHQKAVDTDITGQFLHIEQKIVSRCNLTLWQGGLDDVLNR
ncbi:unnamed protein product [Bursaphelenchus okinawaensis]|uniref:Uncharacterized protein n=1 Tax=Bursaphelenchus okinawaensis TaxID=465554 RepID=A0A811KZD0_9BILA|nr:unnamed protein product [Bursaphelenchus okinawaensis]CAG9115039.1 unnamed protein product [Bursaphelenchus okinawaensis]